MEIYQVTGNCKSEMKEDVKPMKYDCLMVALDIDREELYCNINYRVDKMMQDGLLDEISKLNTMGIDFSKQSMQAIGYKEFENYFNGTISIDDTVEIIKKNTRNYAKRQITWLKFFHFRLAVAGNLIDFQSSQNSFCIVWVYFLCVFGIDCSQVLLQAEKVA